MSLWSCQVGVKISGHQQRSPVVPLSDVCNDIIYCRGIVWGQIATYDIPHLFGRAMEADRLNREVLRLVEEYVDTTDVRDRHLRRHYLVSTRLLRVAALGYLSLLE